MSDRLRSGNGAAGAMPTGCPWATGAPPRDRPAAQCPTAEAMTAAVGA